MNRDVELNFCIINAFLYHLKKLILFYFLFLFKSCMPNLISFIYVCSMTVIWTSYELTMHIIIQLICIKQKSMISKLYEIDNVLIQSLSLAIIIRISTKKTFYILLKSTNFIINILNVLLCSS